MRLIYSVQSSTTYSVRVCKNVIYSMYRVVTGGYVNSFQNARRSLRPVPNKKFMTSLLSYRCNRLGFRVSVPGKKRRCVITTACIVLIEHFKILKKDIKGS